MSQSLAEISTKITQIVLPMIIVAGVVGNSLNIIILNRPNLRNHACSKYFLALASNNVIYSSFIIDYFLSNGFNINGQIVSNALCKILQYIGSVCAFLSPYFIILATIDRFFASSSNVTLRRFSNIVVAKYFILIVVSCSLLLYINTLVSYELYDDGYGCALRSKTIFNQVLLLVQVLLFAAVPPVLMLIFGFLTIYNITRSRVLQQVTRSYRRTEGQLIRMLFFQVVIYILLNIPLCILYLLLIIPSSFIPTSEFFITVTIAQIFFHLLYTTPFFLYILSARVYREELIHLISKIYRIRERTQVQPMPVAHHRNRTTVGN
ncbi:unnamed protein product [Adineta steineri]|uniref:G-protein coupled receptors family 1 profile domain-containing protein n=1 Tax=Adineta steineri TaxID=433720 RepID=A0A813Q3B9_9BILA|nr:unnamed protein product [Adineta steineri]CAF3858791.1 unnamed protein product [Adineta steineri]